jgi:hypothetical protein
MRDGKKIFTAIVEAIPVLVIGFQWWRDRTDEPMEVLLLGVAWVTAP